MPSKKDDLDGKFVPSDVAVLLEFAHHPDYDDPQFKMGKYPPPQMFTTVFTDDPMGGGRKKLAWYMSEPEFVVVKAAGPIGKEAKFWVKLDGDTLRVKLADPNNKGNLSSGKRAPEHRQSQPPAPSGGGAVPVITQAEALLSYYGFFRYHEVPSEQSASLAATLYIGASRAGQFERLPRMSDMHATEEVRRGKDAQVPPEREDLPF